jgi:hypothetical protein
MALDEAENHSRPHLPLERVGTPIVVFAPLAFTPVLLLPLMAMPPARIRLRRGAGHSCDDETERRR